MKNFEKFISTSKIDRYIDGFKINDACGNKFYLDKDFAKSIEYFQKSLENCSEIMDLIKENESKEELEKYTNIINTLIKKIALAHRDHGNTFYENEDYENAIEVYQKSLYYNSSDFFTYFMLGSSLKNLKILSLALEFFHKTMELNPSFDEAYRLAGDVWSFYDKIDYAKAIKYYEKYLQLNKTNPYLFNHMGHINGKQVGCVEKAMEYFKEAIRLKPDYALAVSNLLFLNVRRFYPYTQKEIYDLTKETVKNYLKAINFTEDKKFKHKNKENKNKNKKLHIAYISQDFYHHATMYFIKPILENHSKQKFTVTCYANSHNTDTITDQVKSLVDNFKNIKDLSDEEVARMINKDKVDILIDLGGHSGHSRILALAYKPAPVQITYVGYPNTTGLPEVDYIITNNILSKPEDQEFYSEKFFFYDWVQKCYVDIDKKLPDIEPLPFLTNGYITFGSFNDLSKLSHRLLKAWAEILQQVPNSKLYICREPMIQENLYSKLEEFGISKDRLILDGKYSKLNYNKVDFALDTFPYSGVTTMFNSLNMGVASVVLYDNTFQGRESANINHYVGLNELTAYNEEEYVKIAVNLANNTNKLIEYKNTLRERLKNSPFCDYIGFTKTIEEIYLKLWDEWCDKTCG